MRKRSPCIAIEARSAEDARRLLLEEGLLDKSLKIDRDVGRGLVYLPVVCTELAVRLVKEKLGVDASICSREFSKRMVWTRELLVKGALEEGGLPRHSYLLVGDIVVFNAKNAEEVERLRQTARVLSQAFPHFKAFYAKLLTEGEERVAKLVHLHGEYKTRTLVKEYGVGLWVDIARAYYNPRLAEEHYKISTLVSNGERVLDMFTGVGGFCLQILARKKAIVYCNDINREAIRLLHESLAYNFNRLKGRVVVLNCDAKLLPEVLSKSSFDRIIMNHPTKWLEFIGVAKELVKCGGTIHLYALLEKREASKSEISKLMGEGFEVKRVEEVLEYSPKRSVFRADLLYCKDGQER
uniref:SAM-dependent methyltransferase TRM5/TYW2-type domain-containing protein n=1 Tax=Fervidicoccus fontis TaxID=683846 RepID=A0A7J3ZJE3_9CREN